MTIDDVLQMTLALPGAKAQQPFGPRWITIKALDKIFAMFDLERPQTVVVKVDPERGAELAEHVPQAVAPAYHMNKRHWVDVDFQAAPADLVRELVKGSYALVTAAMPRKKRYILQRYSQLQDAHDTLADIDAGLV